MYERSSWYPLLGGYIIIQQLRRYIVTGILWHPGADPLPVYPSRLTPRVSLGFQLIQCGVDLFPYSDHQSGGSTFIDGLFWKPIQTMDEHILQSGPGQSGGSTFDGLFWTKCEGYLWTSPFCKADRANRVDFTSLMTYFGQTHPQDPPIRDEAFFLPSGPDSIDELFRTNFTVHPYSGPSSAAVSSI